MLLMIYFRKDTIYILNCKEYGNFYILNYKTIPQLYNIQIFLSIVYNGIRCMIRGEQMGMEIVQKCLNEHGLYGLHG